MRTRIGAAIATVVACAGMGTIAAPAHAAGSNEPQVGIAAIQCDGPDTWYTVSSVVKPKKMTHLERYYNGSGATMSTSFTATMQTQLTASVTVSQSVSVEAGVVIGKLSGTAGVSLAASGQKTSGTSVGISANLPNGKALVAYRGNVQVSGSYTKHSCSRAGASESRYTNSAKSFSGAETGAQRCDLSAPSGSMAALAKSQRC